ncbi:GNAT family N-acetyltransferase [Rhizobium sp. WYJ-E13]|uniref:GNAT family N-acetyltransferase n=1 Tax=Rhizobium sp. WYJ-E13 TaxID=2849093 RepID=UPI001C1F0FDB|nr:GNAT family N-acetyltransferase [Rhizobium sp. WYJ-E13]QWW72459.1 GNAT family N-acetyltransferase [Rhizobium sp. WYJ-E13]
MFNETTEAKESVQQLAGVWADIIRDRGLGEVRDLPGISIRWSDTAFAFFNTLTLTDEEANGQLLQDRLLKAANYMADQSKSGFLWLFEDLLDADARNNLEHLANEAGLVRALSGYAMAGDILPMGETHHQDLVFRRAATQDDTRLAFDINAAAYGMGAEDVRDGMLGSRIWHERAYTYLGFSQDHPVSTASVIEHDGRLFLALVATLPDHQRRGFGEATCRKALQEAWKGTGLTRSVLQATEAGAPVYERIGYKKSGAVGFWALKA